jgi:hypothetical protein
MLEITVVETEVIAEFEEVLNNSKRQAHVFKLASNPIVWDGAFLGALSIYSHALQTILSLFFDLDLATPLRAYKNLLWLGVVLFHSRSRLRKVKTQSRLEDLDTLDGALQR